MNQHLHRLFTHIQTKTAYQLLVLLGIILLAAALRFYKLGEWSFWFDEVSTVNRANVHYTSLTALFGRPFPSIIWLAPSLIFTGQAFNLLGIGEWSARLAPALFGLAAIPIIFFCARWLIGPGVGLLSAAILSLTPAHLFWSQNARFYTAMMLFVMLALFSFYYALERDRSSFILIGYFLLYLAVSERLTALLAFPAFLAYLLLVYLLRLDKPAGYHKRNLILLLLPVAAFILFELALLLITGSSFLQDALQIFGVNRGPSPFRLLYRVVLDMGVVLSCLALVGGIYLLASKNRAGFFLVSFAVTPVLLLMLLNPFVFTDERYIFMTLPAWIMLTAVAIAEIASRLRATEHGLVLILALPLLVLSVDLFTDMRYYQSNQGHRLDWRGAFALVEARQQEGDVIASYWPVLADYYLADPSVDMQILRRAEVARSGQRYWFVIDDYALWSAEDMSAWVQQRCELVQAEELLLERPHQLAVYFCDPARVAPPAEGK